MRRLDAVIKRRSVEAGERLAAATKDSLYVQADIAKGGDCERLVATVLEHYGHLDVLINNAGTTKVIPSNRKPKSTHASLTGYSWKGFRPINGWS